ncbi:MAG: deoxyribodipyrimidine photo-lyase [Flavobacteriales bacterium]
MTIFWFRRDLRLLDNTGLNLALSESKDVQPIFIFDDDIIDELSKDDPRLNFIYQELLKINKELLSYNSSLKVYHGNPLKVFKELSRENPELVVYTNRDYEPYAIKRDEDINQLLLENGSSLISCKDQVIFEKNEVVKNDGLPYTVFTPFKNKWLAKFKEEGLHVELDLNSGNFNKSSHAFPSLKELGLEKSSIEVPSFSLEKVHNYEETRNFPFLDSTSKIGPHLRFGTVSIREIVSKAKDLNDTYLSELVWREFFMQILWHFPKVVHENFRKKYDFIQWRNNQEEFEKWCKGETGYPLVDAGMRELNKTGFMHNRVRMVTAGFLCKHLLIDWRWGEAYFAKKLLDYELSSNNGNWQWSAGTGCDAAPYFRVFNPSEQIKKFDKQNSYINKWIEDFNEFSYPDPIVEHSFARNRAIASYKEGLLKFSE